MRLLRAALCIASFLSVTACATSEVAVAPPAPMAPPEAPAPVVAEAPPQTTPAPAPAAAPAQTTPTYPRLVTGEQIYSNRCSGCHNNDGGRGPPPKATLASYGAAYIYQALTEGAMVFQGSGLTDLQKQTVADYIASGA